MLLQAASKRPLSEDDIGRAIGQLGDNVLCTRSLDTSGLDLQSGAAVSCYLLSKGLGVEVKIDPGMGLDMPTGISCFSQLAPMSWPEWLARHSHPDPGSFSMVLLSVPPLSPL